jgi:hypothetical protein
MKSEMSGLKTEIIDLKTEMSELKTQMTGTVLLLNYIHAMMSSESIQTSAYRATNAKQRLLSVDFNESDTPPSIPHLSKPQPQRLCQQLSSASNDTNYMSQSPHAAGRAIATHEPIARGASIATRPTARSRVAGTNDIRALHRTTYTPLVPPRQQAPNKRSPLLDEQPDEDLMETELDEAHAVQHGDAVVYLLDQQKRSLDPSTIPTNFRSRTADELDKIDEEDDWSRAMSIDCVATQRKHKRKLGWTRMTMLRRDLA